MGTCHPGIAPRRFELVVKDAYVADRLVDAEAGRPNSARPKLRKPEMENTERPEAGSG